MSNLSHYTGVMEKSCTRCKKIKPLTEFNKNKRSLDGHQYYCRQCMAEIKQELRNRPEWREADQKKKRETYLSTMQVPELVEEIRRKNRENVRRWRQDPEVQKRILAKRRALRQDALDAYGGSCACCGESEEAFLQIDHVNGGGNQHRKETFGSKSLCGDHMYRWLKQNGYPKGFQVLCANCNIAKERPGGCPHRRHE